MVPKTSLLRCFTRTGRLQNRWAKAVANRDHAKRASELRAVCDELGRLRKAPPELVESVVVDFLKTDGLSEDDLVAIERRVSELEQDSSSTLDFQSLWDRLLASRDKRGELRQSRAVLVRMYQSKRLAAPARTDCLRQLAKRDSQSDEHIELYLNYLDQIGDPAAEVEILKVLEHVCDTGTDSSKVRLKRAAEVALRLVAKKIDVPGALRAGGLKMLILDDAPEKAEQWLVAALKRDRRDISAAIALTSAWIRCGKYDKALRLNEKSQNDTIQSLVLLASTLKWLEDATVAGPPPTSARQLANANLLQLAGDRWSLAVGRLHLIEGDARSAVEALGKSVERNPMDVERVYHYAWALGLCGNEEALRRCFDSLDGHPQRWVVALICRDLRPELVTEEELTGCIEAQSDRNQSAIRARLALFKLLPFRLNWKPEAGSFAENLEGFRTLLAVGFRVRSDKIDLWLQSAWMNRLPRAEQLLWRGVRELLFGYRERGAGLLDEAIQLGSKRASLILGVSLLERNNTEEYKRYVDSGLKGRSDEKAELLRAHINACQGRSDEAIKGFERLRANGCVRATYALRNLYVHYANAVSRSKHNGDARVYLEQAAGLPEHKSGAPYVCPDDRLIYRSVRCLMDPRKHGRELAECFREFESLPPSRRQPWLVWVAAVAQFSAGDHAAVESACRTVTEFIQSSESLEQSVVRTFARESAAAFGRRDVTLSAEPLHQLLNELAQVDDDDTVRYYRDLLAAKAASCQESGTHAVRLAHANQSNVPIWFLAARSELRNGNQAAVAVLEEFQARDDWSREFVECFIGLLKGRSPSVDNIPTPASDRSASLIAAVHWISAIASLGDGQTQRCFETILQALACRAAETPILRLDRILPALCSQVAVSGAPPAPIIELVKQSAVAAKTAEDAVVAARCAMAIGESELACKLLTKALESADASDPAIPQEYKRLLCHLAVQEAIAGNSQGAASRLLSAAVALGPTGSNVNSGDSQLNGFARNLHLESATSRVLQGLFRISGVIPVPTSRYWFLARAIEKDDSLFASVQLDANIDQHMVQLLESRRNDVEFLHGLAVSFREQAIAARNSGSETPELWRTSVALWTLLLSSNAFWREFSRDRLTQHGTDDRVELPDTQLANLRSGAIRGLLTFHMSEGKRAFGMGNMSTTRMHLQNLVLCQCDHSALRSVLEAQNIAPGMKCDDRLLQEAAEVAAELVDDFAVQILRDAKKAADDPDAIARLPEGIRHNYKGALEQLDRFHALDVPSVRAMRASLEYYNDWCYDLYVTQQFDQIKTLMVSARTLADRLTGRCTHGLGHAPENQALSTHFLLRGFTNDDSEAAVVDYEEALRWNPANDNARKLLGQAAERVLTQQLNLAVESAEKGRFGEAYQIIDGVAEQLQGDAADDSVARCRALVHFRHAESLASDGHFRKALDQARMARQLEPDQPVISKFVREMEELAPEEEAIRYFKTAQENMSQEDFSAAISSADRVPTESKYFAQAKQLRSAAHFRTGAEAASNKRFTDAVKHLELSLTLNDSAEETRIIRDQLQAVLFQQGIDAANNQRFSQASSCLEAALRQNPKSEHAPLIREQLEALAEAALHHSVYQATEKGRWDDAANLLRTAIAGAKDGKRRKELNSHLSQVLNAHAVKLLNSDQERMKPFHEALKDIMATAHLLQSSYRPTYGRSQEPPDNCAVCGSSGSSGGSLGGLSEGLFSPGRLESTLWDFPPAKPFGSKQNPGRTWVAMRVLDRAAASGSFAVDGLAIFWRQFDEALCFSCKQALTTPDSDDRARKLLKEAISADSENAVAKKNLASIGT